MIEQEKRSKVNNIFHNFGFKWNCYEFIKIIIEFTPIKLPII